MLKLFYSKSGDNELNEQELALLVILNGLQCDKHEYLFTSMTEISYTMTGRWIDIRNKDRRLYENIRTGIKSLADKEIIKIIDQNGDSYVISNDGLKVDTDKNNFIVVELWEIQRIFSQANKPFGVFCFFMGIVGTINNITKEWHMSQDEMAVSFHCSKRTVNSYLEQLEAMHLIYVYRHKKRRADGTYHKLNNSYGRYADKDAIIKAAQEYADTVECEDIITKIDRRSIKLRYNAFCNHAKKYQNNPAAIMQLYKECKLYNKSLKNNPVEGSCDGEWKHGELLDLSVFSHGMDESEHDDQWGETDPLIDFSVEEILDMPTVSEVQSEPCKKVSVTDSDLKSEGDNPKMESEQGLQNSSTLDREDLELIDIVTSTSRRKSDFS